MRVYAFFLFLATLLVCLVGVSAEDEKERDTDGAPKFDFDLKKMFGGLKDAFKFEGEKGLFGDLGELGKVFGGGDGEGKDALKGLDLSKLFEGFKDKNKTVEKKKKKKDDMLGECDGAGTTCRVEGEDTCICNEATQFCASSLSNPFTKDAKSRRNTCVLRPGQTCTKNGGSNAAEFCASGKCEVTNKVGNCKQSKIFDPCDMDSDCADIDGKTSCGPGGFCCFDPGYDCEPKGARDFPPQKQGTACCGSTLPGTQQITCVSFRSQNGSGSVSQGSCASCLDQGEACFYAIECCGFRNPQRPNGAVCRQEDTCAAKTGFCGSCVPLGETSCDPGFDGGNDCCQNPNNVKQTLDCQPAGEGGECCVPLGDDCATESECCDPLAECIVNGPTGASGPTICQVQNSDRRRMAGSGPIGVDAASTAIPAGSVPLSLQNRTNPHGSQAKLDAMGKAKKERERKGKGKKVLAKAPWLDHYFGFSLDFSDNCSLLAVGEPGTDEQQGAVSVYRLRDEIIQMDTPTAPTDSQTDPRKPLPFSFALPPKRRLVTRPDPPLAGERLSWTSNPTTDRVTLSSNRLTLSEIPSSQQQEQQQTVDANEEASEVGEMAAPQIQIETLEVDLAPPRRRFRPRSRDRGGRALFGTAVSQCSVSVGGDEDEYVHFLAVSAPGSWHGNVFVYVLTEGERGGSLLGRVGDNREQGFGYELVQELVSQGGKGPYDFLQRLTLRDAGGFGEARMGQTVRFIETREKEEEKEKEIVLLTTEQRENAQAYGFRMDLQEPQWPPFVRIPSSDLEGLAPKIAVA